MDQIHVRIYDSDLLKSLDEIKKENHFDDRNQLINYALKDFVDRYTKEKTPHSPLEKMLEETIQDEFKKRDNRIISLLGITLLESAIMGSYYDILLKNMDIDDYDLLTARKKAINHTNKIIGGAKDES